MLILMQISIEAFLVYGKINANSYNERIRFAFVASLLPSLLEIVFSLLLVVSACYITSWVRKSTGKKQNTCLLTWHIVNLFILTIVIALSAILYKKTASFDDNDKDFWKYQYYYEFSYLV